MNKPFLESVDKCALCEGSSFDPELQAGDWQLCRCRSCGLVFTSPRYQTRNIRQLYEKQYYETADSYLKTQLAPPSGDELTLARRFHRKCFSGYDRQPRSLDVGCGAGRIVRAFRQAGWDAWGCDPSAKAVELGKAMESQLCEGELHEITQEEFDLLTAFHVLEHTVDPKEFLSQCHAKLRPGGFILLEVPDYGSRRARAMKESWPFLYPDTHFYQFTASTLQRLLIQTGFRIDRLIHVGGRGPLEDTNRGPSTTKAGSSQSGWRNRIFGLRHLIYWIPGLRSIVRHFLWQVLGYGEYLRVVAQRNYELRIRNGG